ncbi:MAG: NAD(P)H-hydrate dehydratase [Meiothermus sp.]|uniref:NAD(P)H-hydrate dehydratase n=1 Tax=Meiothermus sp. TaxID=1955249 RepID=UPI0025DBA8F8|nr:NAD(P)H-hydrate dehydratase [Meiothermus sp.]MCS7067127.1 NAD(P)H-hydrate dehydratase [Meiothermus sp.]MDW8425213.1 NAD(P)H-hydrate dehydratase [Meiothermus sp.]
MRLFTAQAMREADQRAVALGYPSLVLMDAAGRRTAKRLLQHFPGRKIVVLCGKGNNGGDGLVAARWLAHWGHEVSVYAADGQEGDAAIARQALRAHGLNLEALAAWRPEAHTVVLDALFGTGLRGPLEGFYAELVERINQSGLPVVAVDLPSGLPYQPHVRADLTVALAGLKHEHLFYPHRAACGRILLDSIGMPPQALENPQLPELLAHNSLSPLLPVRPGNAHKGSVGRVLVVGGYHSYTGAPSLAALGAYRSGAGLVTVAYPADCDLQPPLEAVRLPLFEWNTANLQTARAEAVAVGMGAGEGGVEAALAALGLALPTVLDADALHERVLQAYARAGRPTILTPHPGEASRLMGVPSEQIARFPLEAAQSLAQRYPGLVVVLKGGPTVLAWRPPGSSEARLAVNSTGNPQMATGGMGDVLAGVMAALLAAGLSAWDAARLGVYLHGLAGDLARKTGLLAHEVAHALPTALEQLQGAQVRDFWEPGYDGPPATARSSPASTEGHRPQ